jgi:APA family basic amino acid/polyamine antiporter
MTELLRTLRLRDLALLIVGAVIGSGIFLVPAQVLRQVHGSTGLATLVWLGGGVLALLGALTYGELATMTPSAGGIYVYVRDGFGRFPAFLYGWSMFLAISSGAVSALAVAFSAYLGAVIPLGPLASKLVAVASIAIVTVVNVLGTRKSSDLQNWTTVIKVLLLVGITVVLLILGRHHSEAVASLWPHDVGGVASGFGLAMITALWACEGWQFVTYAAGEAINPRPRFSARPFLGGPVPDHTLCSRGLRIPGRTRSAGGGRLRRYCGCSHESDGRPLGCEIRSLDHSDLRL